MHRWSKLRHVSFPCFIVGERECMSVYVCTGVEVDVCVCECVYIVNGCVCVSSMWRSE